MKYIFLFAFFLYSFSNIAQTNKTDIKEDNLKNEVEQVEQEKSAVDLPFEFTKATSQKFNGGAPGSGTTTMVTVFLNKLTDVNLEFSKIWLNNERPYYALKLKRKHIADNWDNYKTDDELILFATSRNNNPGASKGKTNPGEDKMPPYQFTGEALIEYTFNNELMYFEMPKIEKLQDINAQ